MLILVGCIFLIRSKMLAYGYILTLYALNSCRPRKDRVGPSALILSPTRELAQQIETEINKINYKGIRRYWLFLTEVLF